MPLLTLTASEQEPLHHTFDIERQMVKLGSADDNDVVLAGETISAHHVQIERISGGFILRDLHSTTGVTLNGTRMEIVDLVNESQVHIGNAILRFQMSDEEMLVLNQEPFTPYERIARTEVDLVPAPSINQPAAHTAPPVQRTAPSANYGSPPRSLSNDSGGMGFFGLLGFLLFMVIAFLGGTAYRHHQETDRNLYKDVEPFLKKKVEQLKTQYESKDS